MREHHSALIERQDSGSGYVLVLKRRWWGVTEKIFLDENKSQVHQIQFFNRSGSLIYLARFDEMRQTLDRLFGKVDTPQMSTQIKQIFGFDPDKDEEETAAADDDEPLNLEGLKGSQPSFELKLGEGLGKGGAPTLGGGDNKLKLDLNMK